ncbi:MAG TPA: hypothetical protein VI322_04050, partial [Candidatus Saccharimonadia bacterium]
LLLNRMSVGGYDDFGRHDFVFLPERFWFCRLFCYLELTEARGEGGSDKWQLVNLAGHNTMNPLGGSICGVSF